MTDQPKIGAIFQHKKRGSTYAVAGYESISAMLCVDNKECVLRFDYVSDEGLYLIVEAAENPRTSELTFELPFTMQVSTPIYFNQKNKYIHLIIYRCLDTGKHWGRPFKEFMDGRFEGIKA